jgi:hypothetical protein
MAGDTKQIGNFGTGEEAVDHAHSFLGLIWTDLIYLASDPLSAVRRGCLGGGEGKSTPNPSRSRRETSTNA